MPSTTAVIIGGGQAGLAMSRCLTDRSIDHVVLERGEVANSWRTERWDSLRLLTPNWQSRLPGWSYDGTDPAGYMTMPEIVRYFDRYAASFAAPIQGNTTVTSVRPADHGYTVETDQGTWTSRSVVVATGATSRPHIPATAGDLPRHVHQTAPIWYRNPDQLPHGGVLVVGASASGVQLADEIHSSGRPVTLAVGSHTRLPRTYRGADIQHWLDAAGVLTTRYDEVRDIDAARRQPSLQLIGDPSGRCLDLGVLHDQGVRITGRFLGAFDGRAVFADDLIETCARSEARMMRTLDRIDAWLAREHIDGDVPDGERPDPLSLPVPLTRLDLASENIRTVLWATGYEPNFDWLDVPVTDPDGSIRHDGGVTDSSGLYVLGLRFLRRRNSSFIDGVGADAHDLAEHLAGHLDRVAVAA